MNDNTVVIDAKSLYEFAKEAEASGLVDMRKARGKRHPCSLIIMMILVGFLSKRFSIRSIGRLFHDPDKVPKLKELFSPYFQIDKFPSTSCLTRFTETCDTEGLNVYVCQWAYQLIDDDGKTIRVWGADGQAVGASKRQKEGGRPKYNVDYYDMDADILVSMDSVDRKSQESVKVEESVRDLLNGHPNVIFSGDAMMSKLKILMGVLNARAKGMFPIKRNNPKLMNAFCSVLEELCLSNSPVVEHYVDLDGEPDGVGCTVIRNTECTFEEEDNKKYDENLKSRPVRDVVFFDDIYPYAYEKEKPDQPTPDSEKGDEDGADGEGQMEAADSSDDDVIMTFIPGPGFEDRVVSVRNARVERRPVPEQSEILETKDTDSTTEVLKGGSSSKETHPGIAEQPVHDMEDPDDDVIMTFIPGPGFEDRVVSVRNARVERRPVPGHSEILETGDADASFRAENTTVSSDDESQAVSAQDPGPETSVAATGFSAPAGENADPIQTKKSGSEQKDNASKPDTQEVSNAAEEEREKKEPVMNPDVKGEWVKYGDRFAVSMRSHGRLERREFDLITDPKSCDIWKYVPENLKDKWEPYIQTIGVATRYRAQEVEVTNGKGKDRQRAQVYKGTITRTVYMFTWIPGSAEEAEHLVRQYWGIEGKLHGVADRLLRQDECNCWVGNSPGNVPLLKKIAYNVLSSIRREAKSKLGLEVPYVAVLEKLTNNLKYIVDILFKNPVKAIDEFVQNHCPTTN